MLSMSHIHPHPSTFQASPVFEVDFNRSGSDYNTKDDSQFIPPHELSHRHLPPVHQQEGALFNI
jgi:hypothetical protein